MDDYEVDETPVESGSDMDTGSSSESSEREERPSEPEREERPSESEREERPSEPEREERPSEPEPEEHPSESESGSLGESGEPEPETPPSEETGGVDESDSVRDLIGAIGDLNQTITDAITEEPEQPSAGEAGGGAGGDFGGEIFFEQTGGTVDLTPVVQVLERNERLLIHTNELLEQQEEVLATQHNDLLQLQANVNFVFLAVAALIGVVLGAAVGKVFHDLWRA